MKQKQSVFLILFALTCCSLEKGAAEDLTSAFVVADERVRLHAGIPGQSPVVAELAFNEHVDVQSRKDGNLFVQSRSGEKGWLREGEVVEPQAITEEFRDAVRKRHRPKRIACEKLPDLEGIWISETRFMWVCITADEINTGEAFRIESVRRDGAAYSLGLSSGFGDKNLRIERPDSEHLIVEGVEYTKLKPIRDIPAELKYAWHRGPDEKPAPQRDEVYEVNLCALPGEVRYAELDKVWNDKTADIYVFPGLGKSKRVFVFLEKFRYRWLRLSLNEEGELHYGFGDEHFQLKSCGTGDS